MRAARAGGVLYDAARSRATLRRAQSAAAIGSTVRGASCAACVRGVNRRLPACDGAETPTLHFEQLGEARVHQLGDDPQLVRRLHTPQQRQHLLAPRAERGPWPRVAPWCNASSCCKRRCNASSCKRRCNAFRCSGVATRSVVAALQRVPLWRRCNAFRCGGVATRSVVAALQRVTL